MKVCFRVDASALIGCGHVMRCLTLADELTQKGGSISFICREEVGHLNELIEQKGFRVHNLPVSLDWVSDRMLTQKFFLLKLLRKHGRKLNFPQRGNM